MSHYTMLYKYGKGTRKFLMRFYFYFSLVFYILGAFLMKKLFHSCLLDMSLLAYRRWQSTISYPTRTRGIIVN